MFFWFVFSGSHLIRWRFPVYALTSRIEWGTRKSEVHQAKLIMDPVHTRNLTHTWKDGGLRNDQYWMSWDRSLMPSGVFAQLVVSGTLPAVTASRSLSLALFSNWNKADSSSIREATACLAAEMFWLLLILHSETHRNGGLQHPLSLMRICPKIGKG